MWETLGLYALINKWRFLQPTNSEIFRISHFLDGGIISKPRATIATGFIDENSKVNTFEPSYFSPREDFQIFELAFPAGLPTHSLGFIPIDDNPGNWVVKVEGFHPNSVEDDFANYLLARFGITSSLFTNMAKHNLITVSSYIELKPGFNAQLLVPYQPILTGLIYVFALGVLRFMFGLISLIKMVSHYFFCQKLIKVKLFLYLWLITAFTRVQFTLKSQKK